MGLNHKSQSALEYMMTYGWAILVIVIVAAVLYSLGIFSPSSSLSTTVTGFANLGTVNAVCLGGTSFTISMGDSTGYPINVTEINLTSSSGKTTYSPNILIQPNSIQTVTVPSSSLCTSGARYSVSAVVSYLEPGQIFPGPYTSTGTVAGTANSLPSSATLYEPLNITNTQNQGTPSPFQQMINVTSTSPGWGDISSSPFGQNVEFFSSTGQILDSWLENYTSTHAIWWVKLTSSISAGSKQTIYIGFAPTSTNLFNTNDIGEAPQLSSTYAEYDDGANVFNFYDNFAGTSLNTNKWTDEGITYTVNNGFTATSTAPSGYIYSSTQVTPPYVIEFYGNLGGQSTGTTAETGGMKIPATNANNFYGVAIGSGYPASGSYLAQMTNNGAISNVVLSGAFQNAVLTINVVNSTTSTYYYNYASKVAVSADAPQYPVNLMLIGAPAGASAYSFSPASFIQWFRTRTYPPNGVMPSVTFGSVS